METKEQPKVENKTAVLDALKKGAVLDYAPISGGLIMIDEKGKLTEIQPTIQTFLDLSKDDKLKHTGTMRQGHAVFHGRVDSFKLQKEEQK